jgi:hypothetical protein
MRLSCGYTLKSPQGARTFWVRVTSSVSAGHPQCTVKIVTNRGQVGAAEAEKLAASAKERH